MACVNLLKEGHHVLYLRISVVLVLELDLGVGRCWANIVAQVCQPALLSVQSFIPFLARITNCTI